MLIELSYNAGWDDAKKSKKRKGNPKMEALVDFEFFNTAARIVNTHNLDDDTEA